MTAPRRPPSDSLAAQAAAWAAVAAGDPKWPEGVHRREGDLRWWNLVVRARARDEWSGTALLKAADWARTRADIERQVQALEVEGDTLTNARGTRIVNPRHHLLETLERRFHALCKELGISESQLLGTPAENENARVAEAEARTAAAPPPDDDDGLLATPGTLQ